MCAILFPGQRLNPDPLHWERGVSATDHQGIPQRTALKLNTRRDTILPIAQNTFDGKI